MCDGQLVLADADVQDWFLGTHVDWVLEAFPKKRYKRTLIFSQTDLLGEYFIQLAAMYLKWFDFYKNSLWLGLFWFGLLSAFLCLFGVRGACLQRYMRKLHTFDCL